MAALVTGWMIFGALAAIALLALAVVARVSRLALGLTCVVLAIAVFGYAWQGHPDLASAPALALQADAGGAAADAKANPMKPAFTREGMALNTAMALTRAHNAAGAVSLLKSELATEPNNAELWLGLGQALVANGDGLITPAALFAFDKAAALQPANPMPSIMHALSLAQGGRFDESAQLISALLARNPKDAPWRPELEQKLALVKQRLAQPQ